MRCGVVQWLSETGVQVRVGGGGGGGGGGDSGDIAPSSSHILEDPLTYFKMGVQILPTKLQLPPPDFQTFLRP